MVGCEYKGLLGKVALLPVVKVDVPGPVPVGHGHHPSTNRMNFHATPDHDSLR